MADIALAFLWHQHQPYYPDDLDRENPMPWVRLHGVKDYYGMALHLLEFPEMRCTINLVPSLIYQLQGYTERGKSDRHLDIARIPADGLNREQARFLLEDFFMANPETMIRPFPRYFELYLRRGAGKTTAQEALKRFQERDLRDLQVWFNLAWIHPLAIERDPELRELQEKGRHFTEKEKQRVLDKHLEILRRVLPLHQQLSEQGQVELTTTPYYHPILPLLLDKRLTREAMPDARLPRSLNGYPEDAELQVRRAVAQHQALFGAAPRGMWPAEGSVCQAMIGLLARYGIRWIATDEEILGQSTHGFVGRDNRGFVRNPDHMYRAYKVADHGQELGIVFRDHALSDLIGFHYQRSDGQPAADDFLGKVRGIGSAVNGPQPALVTVILDGENCWEHYPGGGVSFLRALYERCTRTPGIRPVRIGEYLEQNPPRDTLPHLFAGSWINHNFDIWIGYDEDNLAWDLLHQTREHLRQRQEQGLIAGEKLRQAWEEIYIAEGSDWFWWYGPHHSSAQDSLFDYLFRKHLQNVYLLLGEPVPAELFRPITRRGQRPIYTTPRSFLEVRINGRRTPIEWMGAGRYTVQNERGTMAMVTQGPLRDLYFGFTPGVLYVRIDLDGPARQVLTVFDSLRLGFVEPAGCDLYIRHPAAPQQQLEWVASRPGVRGPESETNGTPAAASDSGSLPPGIEVGIDQIVEIAIPFTALGVKVDQPMHFFVELLEGNQSRDRAPRVGTINLNCPSPDFERIMWDV
jgi:alpha-amylase/alpha-mannosidase (GH57 family)